MANLFWVGNGGNTNDTAHWSLTSGGAGGASLPGSGDNVYFDVNSFTLAGQVVTVNGAFLCVDMDWTGALNTPTFAGSLAISIFGSLTFIAAMNVTNTSTIQFRSVVTGKTITSAGRTFGGAVDFNGVGGGWTLQDALNFGTSQIQHTNGTLNTNNQSVTCGTFNESSTNTRTLTLGSSIITCSGSWTVSATGLTFNAGTSTIIMTTPAGFTGAGLTYNNLTVSSAQTTIIGSNTFNVLTILAGKTLKLTSGTTQTVTSFVCNGTTASPSTLQAVTASSVATIALPAGRYFIRHTSIKDITISGATTVTSIAGTNVSGNTGITFVTKFEMGRIKNDGSFNWYSTATGTVTKVSG